MVRLLEIFAHVIRSLHFALKMLTVYDCGNRCQSSMCVGHETYFAAVLRAGPAVSPTTIDRPPNIAHAPLYQSASSTQQDPQVHAGPG